MLKQFATIKEAASMTGLSVYYLRNGCRVGSVPAVKSGNRFLINVPKLLEKLDRESEERTEGA